MEKGLARVCDGCGEKCTVRLTAHYLGVKFIEECRCGVRLCRDPYEVNWFRYAQKTVNKSK